MPDARGVGNLFDRLMVGGARDWIITPMAVTNLADGAGWLVAALFAAELIVYPPARRLLRVDPRRWRQSTAS